MGDRLEAVIGGLNVTVQVGRSPALTAVTAVTATAMALKVLTMKRYQRFLQNLKSCRDASNFDAVAFFTVEEKMIRK